MRNRVAFNAKWRPNGEDWRMQFADHVGSSKCKWDNPGRKQNGPRAKGLPVEYRDIRYTVRARIERDQWTVSIHPADIKMLAGFRSYWSDLKIQVVGFGLGL